MTSNAFEGIVDALDDSGIPFMVAGSLASSMHGEARSTADIDLVIDPPPGKLERLLRALDSERWYVNAESAHRAVGQRGQFNVIDTTSQWKIDLMVRKDRPFSRSEFSRRTPATIGGSVVFVATAEDTVLAKLEWAKSGGSDRQLRDVVGILAARAGGLDDAYLDLWAPELGVTDLLATVRSKAAAGAA